MSDGMIPALGRMADCCRFFVYLLTWNEARAKFDKKPVGSPAAASMTYSQAHAEVLRLRASGKSATVGLWLTADSDLWFLDIDKLHADYTPDERTNQLLKMFPGAFVEWSSSRRGIHIVGTMSTPVPHGSRNDALHLEFYTQDRGIALNIDAQPGGCMDSTHDVAAVVAQYFPLRDVAPISHPEWRGPSDDDELIRRALAARDSAAVTLGGKPSFAQLWNGEAERNSENDSALAMRLAFWTGCDDERIARLMQRSGLVRDKWRTHRTYLATTIKRACGQCSAVYQEPQTVVDGGAANPCTELSNAYRLKTLHGADMMAVDGIGWHVWNGSGPWKRDHRAAHRLAFGLGKVIQAEAEELDAWVNDERIFGSEEQERRAEFQHNRMKWAKSSESKAVIDHGLSLAEKLLGVDADSLDASPTLVGCPNGVIDLATGVMRKHRRDDRITKTLAVDYDPNASAPTFQRFIAEIFGSDPELIEYVQTLCGYALSGKRGDHLLPIFYGTGANGKSTFLTILQTLLSDYAGVAAPGLLIARGGSDHPTGLAALQGKRLVVVSETGESGRLNEEQVKLLTGGDRITARLMRQDFFEFEATHLIVLQTNHKPRVTGNDEGIWRRVKLIPFTVTIPPEKRDPELLQKLLPELPGILAWAVAGFRMYQARGFKEPNAVRAATAEYRSDSDHVGAFLAERCKVGLEYTATASELYANYQNWCALSGERPLSQRALGLRLSERPGIEQARTNQARTWRGVALDHAAPLRLVQAG